MYDGCLVKGWQSTAYRRRPL